MGKYIELYIFKKATRSLTSLRLISSMWLRYPWCPVSKKIRELGASRRAGFRRDQSRKVSRSLYIFFFSAKGFSSSPRFNLPETLYTREFIGRVKAARVSRQTDLLWLVSSWYFVFLQQTAATSQLRVLDTYINRDVTSESRMVRENE